MAAAARAAALWAARPSWPPILPKPHPVRDGDTLHLTMEGYPDSIGRMKAFYGNFLTVVRALTYVLTLGKEGIPEASHNAVLNANYLKHELEDTYDIHTKGHCMHEFVITLDKHAQGKRRHRHWTSPRPCWMRASIRPPCTSR